MTLPLVYHEDYVTPLPAGHRFPMPKFGLLRDHLVEAGLARADAFDVPERAARDQLRAVHESAYLDAFERGMLPDSAVRRIGLPWSKGLVNRTITAVGGTIHTAELALAHGLACNTAGGTHHAFPGYGSGFCILNDLAVAAKVLLTRGQVDQVLIIDLDVHQGDGTAWALRDEPRAFTFSMHAGSNFPLRKQASDLDVALPDSLGDEAYLRVLREGNAALRRGEQRDGYPSALGGQEYSFEGLDKLLERVEPDLVLFDAGVDVHRDDRLGRLALSDTGLAARDRAVLRCCRSHGVPVACVIGGGYDQDHALLAARHASVHVAALEVAAGTLPADAQARSSPAATVTARPAS